MLARMERLLEFVRIVLDEREELRKVSVDEIVQELAKLIGHSECAFHHDFERVIELVAKGDINLGFRLSVSKGRTETSIIVPDSENEKLAVFYSENVIYRGLGELLEKLFLKEALRSSINVSREIDKHGEVFSLSLLKVVPSQGGEHHLKLSLVKKGGDMFLDLAMWYFSGLKTPVPLEDEHVLDKSTLVPILESRIWTNFNPIIYIMFFLADREDVDKVRIVLYKVENIKVLELWVRKNRISRGIAFKIENINIKEVKEKLRSIAEASGRYLDVEFVGEKEAPKMVIFELVGEPDEEDEDI